MPVARLYDDPPVPFPRDQVTTVIPAKDEAESIAELIDRAAVHSIQILVVDGHSKDDTRLISEQHGARVILDGGKGKGEAIRCAIPHVTTPITVFMDADWSHDPEDIPKLATPILNGSAEHVTGSRLIGGSSELHGGFDEFLRLMGSSFITACINFRFGARLSDSQNGFRAIKTEVLRDLGLNSDITTIEQEMIMKTLRLGYRMAEVPTHEYSRKYGKSHIRLSRVWFWYGGNLIRNLL